MGVDMIKKNKHVITIVILFATICLWGLCADYNFIRFKLYDDVNVNYNFSESEKNDMQLAYSVVFPSNDRSKRFVSERIWAARDEWCG